MVSMRSSSSNFLTTAGVLGLAVLLTLALSGGTYARWGAQVELPAATITAGNAEMSIEHPSIPTTGQAYPGQAVRTAFTVNNTGTVPLDLQVASLTWLPRQPSASQQALADNLTLDIWPVTGDHCGTPPSPPSWSGTLSSPPEELGVIVDPGAAQSMCLATTLQLTAPDSVQGVSITVEVTVEGIQTMEGHPA